MRVLAVSTFLYFIFGYVNRHLNMPVAMECRHRGLDTAPDHADHIRQYGGIQPHCRTLRDWHCGAGSTECKCSVDSCHICESPGMFRSGKRISEPTAGREAHICGNGHAETGAPGGLLACRARIFVKLPQATLQLNFRLWKCDDAKGAWTALSVKVNTESGSLRR